MRTLSFLCLPPIMAALLCTAQTSQVADQPQLQPPAKESAAVASPVPLAATKLEAHLNPSPDSYVIGPGDVLAINVWKEQELSSTLLVRPDGMISVPLLGDIPAANLTAVNLADQLSAKLKKFVQNPNVTVLVTQIHSKMIYMLGEVARKGPIEMTADMTILEAISIAGGLTDFANARKIYILRNENGERQIIRVRYKDALKGNKAFDLLLKPEDKIVVP
jgi:polysaccharide export outer membrane protein